MLTMHRRNRDTVRKATLRTLVAAVALVSAITASAALQPCAEANPPKTVSVEIGAKADYGGWGTRVMTADGNPAYCVQPDKTTPTSGTYNTSPLSSPGKNDDLVRAMLYFGYGGPGYDPSIWPDSWPNDEDRTVTPERRYAMTHLTVAYAWLGDMEATLYRVWDTRADWFHQYLFGVDGNGTVLNEDAPYQLISKRISEVPASFQAFSINAGAADQTLVGWTIGSDVTFTKVSANASVSDGNQSYALEGARYDIYESSSGERVASIETGKDGTARCTLAPNTSYYAIETKAPTGFVIDPSPKTFVTDNGPTAVTLEDAPQTARLAIRKRDALGSEDPQVGATFEGAEFEVSYQLDGKRISSTVVTDADGVATIDGLPLGKIVMQETKAPAGYLLDPEPHTYTAEAGTETEHIVEIDADGIREHPISCDIEIVKYAETVDGEGTGIKKPVQGVRFEILSNTTAGVVATIESDQQGTASTADPECVPEWALAPDRTDDPSKPWFGKGTRTEGVAGALPYDANGYTVREVPETVPEGFERVDDWTVPAESLADGAQLNYIVNNHSITTRLQIVKTDAESGQTVPLAGFTFQVLDSDMQPITQTAWYPQPTTVSEFTTDESGTVTLPEALEAGTYYIREIAAPSPYILGEDLEFRIDGAGNSAPLTIATYADEPVTGEATIVKTDPSEREALAGAEFDLVALEDIIGADGTLQASKNQVIAHVVTDGNGTATVEGLPLGTGEAKFAFVETKAPSGYRLDRTPHPFTLSWQDDSTPVVSAHITAHDEPTNVRIEKTGEEAGDPVAGTTFTLWSVADVADADISENEAAVACVGASASDVRLIARADNQSESRVFEPLEGDGTLLFIVPLGTYGIETLDDKGFWAHMGDIEIDQATMRSTVIVQEERAFRIPDILRADANVRIAATDEAGSLEFEALPPGSYRLCEVAAPEGFIVSHDIRSIEVDEEGKAEPETLHLTNACTRIDVSKRSVSGEEELPGATLSLLDEQGNIVETWISGDKPHRIEKLEPGTYSLVEVEAPRTHETAQRVTFEVKETGDVQTVVMRDKPIEIEGELDKRQDIATPVAAGTWADDPHAAAQQEAGIVHYSVDVRNASTTWTDEFTITDELEAVQDGYATLESITTPQAWKDFDGRLNVWYRTNLSEGQTGKGEKTPKRTAGENGEPPDGETPNATRSDGHENPWFDKDEAWEKDPDGDRRILDYTGWRVWMADVPATAATTLSVADLGLQDGEYITAIRLEYGRVEEGFSTCTSAWDNASKAEHDCWDRIDATHDERFTTDQGEERAYAPLMVTMRVTDRYVAGTKLRNSATVSLYRNGGGEGLEDHDEDHVVQQPASDAEPLPQTGTLSLIGSLLLIGALAGCGYALLRARR